MYLTERDVRELLASGCRPIRRGELLFDTLSPLGPRLSKVFTNGIVKWGIRDAREIEAWNPRPRFVERTSALAGYERSP